MYLEIIVVIVLCLWAFMGVFAVADRSSSPALEDFNWKQKIFLTVIGGPICWSLCPLFITIEFLMKVLGKCCTLDGILNKLETKESEL